MNTIINVECVDQDLIVTNAPTLASGGICENVVSFKFCGKWDDFSKTAVFYQNEKNVYYALIDSQNKCEIPHEVTLNEGTLHFGVFGVNGNTRRTSKVDKIRIHKGAWTKDMHPSDPTPDIYTQILASYNEIIKNQDSFINSQNQMMQEYQETWLQTVDTTRNEMIDEVERLVEQVRLTDASTLNGLTAEEFVSNENLLINADFRNPVNSNGKTAYGGYQWTIDKWFTNYDTTVSVKDGHITIKGDNNIRQDLAGLDEGYYTLSAKVRSAENCSMYIVAKDSSNVNVLGVNVVSTLTKEWTIVQATGKGTPVNVIIGITDPSRGQGLSFDLEWVKLERGSVATPFIPQNLEVEKLKCGIDMVRADGYTLSELYSLVPNYGKQRFIYIGSLPSDFPTSLAKEQLHDRYLSVTIEKVNTVAYYKITGVYSSGYPYDYETYTANGTISKWRDMSDGGNADTVDGKHASDFLPITGGTMNGYLKFQSASNGKTDLFKNHSETTDYGFMIRDTDVDGKTASLSVRAKANCLTFIDNDGNQRTVMHNGNVGNYALPIDGSVPMSGKVELKSTSNDSPEVQFTNSVMSVKVDLYNDVLRAFGVFNGEVLYPFQANFTSKNFSVFGNTVLHTGNSQKVVVSDTPLTAEGSVRVW